MKEGTQDGSNLYKTYLCEYRFDGETWGIDIPARSAEEAKERLQRIGHGRVVGTLEGVVRVSRRSAILEFVSNMSMKFINLPWR